MKHIILDSIKEITNNSKFVKINNKRLNDFAKLLKTKKFKHWLK